MDWWRIVCCAAAGYLLGSCNGAIVVSHTCMHDDIRKKGSGNAGLTNFLRNFGGWATLLVVLMDMGKVVLACLLGRWLLPGNPQLGMMIAGAMTELVIFSRSFTASAAARASCRALHWRS